MDGWMDESMDRASRHSDENLLLLLLGEGFGFSVVGHQLLGCPIQLGQVSLLT
jgi:hypothetical protein